MVQSIKQLDNIFNLMKAWVVNKRVGSIQVNFMKGGVTNVNIKRSLKAEDIEVEDSLKIKDPVKKRRHVVDNHLRVKNQNILESCPDSIKPEFL